MKIKLDKRNKIIIIAPSGSGKSYKGLSIIKKKNPKTVLIGSCTSPEFYESSFPFLKDYKWQDHNTNLQPHTGEKVFITDSTGMHVATQKMNYFCEDCYKDKNATIFYDDGTWGENGFLELWKMSHYKCNIIITANSLSDVLKMRECDITEDMKKDLSKLGWIIMEMKASPGTGMRRAIIIPNLNQRDELYSYKRPEGEMKQNIVVIGTAVGGKGYHPWDNLKPCPCGCKERPLLMYKKDEPYFCGGSIENVFAVCSVCGRHTPKTDISTTINNWNNDKTVDVQKGD